MLLYVGNYLQLQFENIVTNVKLVLTTCTTCIFDFVMNFLSIPLFVAFNMYNCTYSLHVILSLNTIIVNYRER